MFRFSLLVVFFIFRLNASASNCEAPHQGGHDHWSEAEHLYLADRGFSLACKDFGGSVSYCDKNQIPRKDGKVSLSYGQVSLLADIYQQAEDIFDEDGSKEISNEGLEKIFKCVDRGGAVHEEQRENPGVDYPHCNWVVFFNTNNGLEALRANDNHFGWYNIKTYVRLHEKALQVAKFAGELKSQGLQEESDLHLRRALYLNGYADHFLTDAFAAGHIRTPRKHLKRWAKKKLEGFFRGYRADLLAMILHDSESIDRSGYEMGFDVKNSLGRRWQTHSDYKLNECRSEDHEGIKLPAQAVADSVHEIFQSYLWGQIPEGVFTATYKVPFSNGVSLKGKLSSQIKSEGRKPFFSRLRKLLPWAFRWVVGKRTINAMFEDMEEIMSAFRKSVRDDVEQSPSLEKRLPKEYVKAYLEVS